MGALDEAYLSTRGGLTRMVARIVPPDDVEDIVQETYLCLRRVVVAQEIRNPSAYLYQTARNLALDSLKRACNVRSVEWCEHAAYAGTDSDMTTRTIDATRRYDRFCNSVEHLPRRAREVFLLKKIHGYSQREIAEQLGIAESTVEKHVGLAVRRCAAYMEQGETHRPVV